MGTVNYFRDFASSTLVTVAVCCTRIELVVACLSACLSVYLPKGSATECTGRNGEAREGNRWEVVPITSMIKSLNYGTRRLVPAKRLSTTLH